MPSFIEREQIREFQPYQTPIQQIANTFSTKLGYWREGISQVKSTYQNYLGLELTNSKNQEGLAEYMKTAKQEIQKASNLDFSVGENVTKILGVFDNLTNGKTEFSKNIMADHSVTSAWNSSLSRAEASRYANGGKEFNQASLDAVQRQKELFRQGDGTYKTSKIASSMLEQYTPYYDTGAELRKIMEAFEADINDKTTPNGEGYLIHQKDASWKAEKLEDFIRTNASDKYKQQKGLEARSEFYNHKLIAKQDPATVINAYQGMFERSKTNEINQHQNRIMANNAEILKLNPKDPEYSVKKQVLNSAITSLQSTIAQVQERAFNPNFILSDDYREGVAFAESLGWSKEVNNVARAFAHQNTTEETKMDQGYFAKQNLQLANNKFTYQQKKDNRDFEYTAMKDARDFSYQAQKDTMDQYIDMIDKGVAPPADFVEKAKAMGVNITGTGITGNAQFQSAGTSNENSDGGSFNPNTGEYINGDGTSTHTIDFQRRELENIDSQIDNAFKTAIIGAFQSIGNLGNKDAEKMEAQVKMYGAPNTATRVQTVGTSNYSPGVIRTFSRILNIPEASVSSLTNGALSTQLDKVFTTKDGQATLKTMIANGNIPNLEFGTFTASLNRQKALKTALSEEGRVNIAKALTGIGIQVKDIDENLRIDAGKLRQAYARDNAWHKQYAKDNSNRVINETNLSLYVNPDAVVQKDEIAYQEWLKEKVHNKLRSKAYTDLVDPKAFQSQKIKMTIENDKKGNLTPSSRSSIQMVNQSLYDFNGSGGDFGPEYNTFVKEFLPANPSLVKEWIVDGNNLRPVFNREVMAELVKQRNPGDTKAESFEFNNGQRVLTIDNTKLNLLENKLKIPIKANSTLSVAQDPLKIGILRSGRELNINIEGDDENKYRISVGQASNTSISNNTPTSVGLEFNLPSLTFTSGSKGEKIFTRDSKGNIILGNNNSEMVKKTNPQLYQQYQRSLDATPTKALDELQIGAGNVIRLEKFLNSPEGRKIISVDQLPQEYRLLINNIR